MVQNFHIMKKLICLFSLTCFIAGTTYAQNTVRISGGTRMTTSGTVQLVLGTGNLINNGVLGGSTGTLVFAGPINYSGTGTTQVANFTVAHSSSTPSVLNSPISVTNTANLMFGNVNANNNIVIRSDLSSSANLVISGTPSASVQGIVVRATTTNGPCPSFLDTLSVNISGPLLIYQWQSSPDSINWSDITGATSISYIATINGTTYYRCKYSSSSNTFIETLAGLKIVLDSPRAAITGPTSVAAGSSITLTGTTAGGVFSTTNASRATVSSIGVVTGVSAGTVTITYTVTNSGGCTDVARSLITVGVGLKPVVKITDPAAVCTPATVNLTAAAITAGSDPNLTYKYYTNRSATTLVNTPIAVSVGGTYYIIGTNTSGITSDTMPVIVTIQSIPKADFTYDGSCINVAVPFTNTSIITGSGLVTYQWSDNTGKSSTATSPTFTFAQTGSVSMKLKAIPTLCPTQADSTTKAITIVQPTLAVRMQPVNIIINEPLELQARNFGSTYVWSPSTGLTGSTLPNPKATLNADQQYLITIKAPTNCITVDSLLVRIYDNRVYVPNVFSPNGDGINDKLFVNVAGVRPLRYFRVFNRYAQLVFETNDITVGWDGKFKNVLQPMDTYIWVAAVAESSGSTTVVKGNITLLR